MASILAANADVRGTVFDLPSGVAQAPQKLSEQAFRALRNHRGNFFRSVPEAADAYVLKYVIHDWDDEQSVAILKIVAKPCTEPARSC